MKSAIIAILVVAMFALASTSPPHPCQCWPNWKPIQEGSDWHCKDEATQKTFHCNIDAPPACFCKEHGVLVQLPLGEVNCVGGGGNKYDNTNCETDVKVDWESWFSKYPQYRLQH